MKLLDLKHLTVDVCEEGTNHEFPLMCKWRLQILEKNSHPPSNEIRNDTRKSKLVTRLRTRARRVRDKISAWTKWLVTYSKQS